MKESKTFKILLILVISVILSSIFQLNTVRAALQSNANEPVNKNRNTWMTEIRKMEGLGGTLGLTETQNSDLTSSSGSNNIDIHMQKNTEYGAMALLSASAFGKPSKIENGETTTGNETGVVIPYNNEWTATQFTDHIGKTSYNEIYINYYVAANTEQKAGDAMIETQGWHGASYKYSKRVPGSVNFESAPGGMVRILGNSIFSYNNSYLYVTGRDRFGSPYNGNDVAHPSNAYKSRAVVINGDGI